MAILVRRGLRRDFNPAKMLAGEWAVSIDADTNNQIVWMCFAPNVVKRMGTYEDFKEQIEEATEDIRVKFEEDAEEYIIACESFTHGGTGSRVDEDTDNAMYYKNKAEEARTLSESFAHGGTGTRAGEDTDNAEKYKELAESAKTEAISYAVGGTGTRTDEDKDNAKWYKEQADEDAENAHDDALLSKSYAVGGTGIPSRPDEDTNNASYWAEKAKEYAEQSKTGVKTGLGLYTDPTDDSLNVLVDGKTVFINDNNELESKATGGAFIINITTEETALKGQDGTISNGTETKPFDFDEFGKARVEVNDGGKYTVICGGASSQIECKYFGIYSVTLALYTATINVTINNVEDYTQTEVTVSSPEFGSKTETITGKTGSITVNKAGTYSVVGSINGVDSSEYSVTVNAERGFPAIITFAKIKVNATYDSHVVATLTSGGTSYPVDKTGSGVAETIIEAYANKNSQWTLTYEIDGEDEVIEPAFTISDYAVVTKEISASTAMITITGSATVVAPMPSTYIVELDGGGSYDKSDSVDGVQIQVAYYKDGSLKKTDPLRLDAQGKLTLSVNTKDYDKVIVTPDSRAIEGFTMTKDFTDTSFANLEAKQKRSGSVTWDEKYAILEVTRQDDELKQQDIVLTWDGGKITYTEKLTDKSQFICKSQISYTVTCGDDVSVSDIQIGKDELESSHEYQHNPIKLNLESWLTPENGMTAQSQDGFTVTSSEVGDTRYGWEAFNYKLFPTSPHYWLGRNVTPNAWLAIEFPNACIVTKVLFGYPGAGGAVKNFILQGSNNGSDSDFNNNSIQTFDVTGWDGYKVGDVKTFNVTNDTKYKYYRIKVTSIDRSDGYIGIGACRMWGKQ